MASYRDWETYGSEMEARQAIAKTTYDLWVDGKLKEGAFRA